MTAVLARLLQLLWRPPLMRYPPPVYTVFATEAYALDRLRLSNDAMHNARHDDPGHEMVMTTEWTRFLSTLPTASAAAVLCPDLDGIWPTRIGSAKARSPLTPLVIVTKRDANNLRRVSAVSVDEVVWPSDVDRDLLPALVRAAGAGFRVRAALAIRDAKHLPVALRNTLIHVLRRDPPAQSIKIVASEMRYAHATLWEHWDHHVGNGFRLLEFIDWVFLLHLAARKTPNRSWASVSAELGVSSNTSARRARRLLDMSLSDLELEGPGFVVNALIPHLELVTRTVVAAHGRVNAE